MGRVIVGRVIVGRVNGNRLILNPFSSGQFSRCSLSSSVRPRMKILKSSGLITWPCSVPTRMSIFSESFLMSLIFVEEFSYMCFRQAKYLPLTPSCESLSSMSFR